MYGYDGCRTIWHDRQVSWTDGRERERSMVDQVNSLGPGIDCVCFYAAARASCNFINLVDDVERRQMRMEHERSWGSAFNTLLWSPLVVVNRKYMQFAGIFGRPNERKGACVAVRGQRFLL